MKIHHELRRDADAPPIVLAFGFFDGMHRGHHEIARAARRLRKPGMRVGVLSFSNHPASFLRPERVPQLICTPEERLDLFAAAGFEECYFVPFDAHIAATPAERFVDEILLGALHVAGIVVGSNFHFGYRRLGTAQLLQQMLAEHGVTVIALENARDEGERISSTRIRELIAKGQCDSADRLLGHSYEIRGVVEIGAGRGHDLGFPTANVRVPDKLLPPDAVYSAIARYDGRDYAALVSIGTNPTFGGTRRTVEAWLRDFSETIYGCEIVLRDLRYVRDQRRFDGAGGLLQQMLEDAAAVAYPSYG